MAMYNSIARVEGGLLVELAVFGIIGLFFFLLGMAYKGYTVLLRRRKLPLHYAAARGQIDIVTSLLSQGADVNAPDDDGLTPLHEAAKKGHKDVVKHLLSSGANMNPKNKNGSTPLYFANTFSGDKDVVELLRYHGGVM